MISSLRRLWLQIANRPLSQSFGFTKFIPRIPHVQFEAAVKASTNSSKAISLWDDLKEHIYALSPEASLSIGKPNAGHVSGYYLGEAPTDEEVTAIQTAAENGSIGLLNTRVRKDGPKEFTLLVSSADRLVSPIETQELADLEGVKLNVEYGDFTEALSKVTAALTQAKKYAASENQKAMLNGYISS
jgi:dipeptidyl-peptidase-3